MSRFVILHHDWPEPHWDLMLEAGEALRTWRLAATSEPGQPVSARATFDHRLHYLDYEGPVSGNRGHVTRWDAGTFAWLADEPGSVVVRLQGQRLQATLTLTLVTGDEWTGTIRKDPD